MVQPTPDPVEPNLNASCAPGWVSKEGLKYCYKVCSAAVIHLKQVAELRQWSHFQLYLINICLNVSAGVSRGAFDQEALVGRGGAFLWGTRGAFAQPHWD